MSDVTGSAPGGEIYGKDVGWSKHIDGGSYLYKKRELLVAVEDSEEVEYLLGEWGMEVQRVDHSARWVRMRLGDDRIPVSELVTRLRADERSASRLPPYEKTDKQMFRVSPNHVLVGSSHGSIRGTGSSPAPAADDLAAPPPRRATSTRVAVLDNGEFYKHGWLDGRVERVTGQGVTSTNPENQPPIPVQLADYDGHGTFVAGLVLQHAPWATVVMEKILNGGGRTTDTEIADAIRRLPDDIDVLLISAAGRTYANIGLPATEEALADLWAARPWVQCVAPAGNAGMEEPEYPAALKGVIGVAAYGSEPAKAPFSNYGAWVDACAPGVKARSTFLSGKTKVKIHGSTDPTGPADGEIVDMTFAGRAYWSGTCFAAARVAGAIADIMERDGVNGAEAAFKLLGGKKRLRDDDYDIGVPVYAPSWS